METIDEKQARKFIELIEMQLKKDFETIRLIPSPSNVKGRNYEIAVKEFFESRLGGLYDFHTRCSLLDSQLKALTLLSIKENEFDIAAVHKTAPSVLHSVLRKVIWIEYDTVAFITSVKQTLSPSFLEEDLEKYQKVNQLQFFEDEYEFKIKHIMTPFTLRKPMKILFYYEGGLSQKIVNNLKEMKGAWDILEIVSKDTLLMNKNLPIAKPFLRKENTQAEGILKFAPNSLSYLLFFLSASIPIRVGLGTSRLLFNLLRTC